MPVFLARPIADAQHCHLLGPNFISIVGKTVLLIAIATVADHRTAAAHAIAGNRYFVGTITIDDPAVADEAILPVVSTLNSPVEGGNATDDRIGWSFARLLTSTLQVSVDSGWIHRSWPLAQASGFDSTDVGIKGEIFRNNEHETLVSAGLSWGIGQSGSQVVGASGPNSIQPGLFFGKGFGDLPAWLSWARPFAITGAIVDEHPFGSASAALAPDAATGKLVAILAPQVETLHWGFTLQYSTYYLTSRYTGGPPDDEPLNQFVPLVEFSFDTPVGQNTAATMNPGLAYVAEAWQFVGETIVPLNREGGNGFGFRAQLTLFIDDLMPALFGKPLLADDPGHSLTAWR
jgi:hypothetical protein